MRERKETCREVWEEIDRDCKRSSEKELQLNSIKRLNPSGERL